MSSPPDDDANEGTVFMPSGFQRSSLRHGDTPVRTSTSWSQTMAPAGPGNALPLGTRIGEFELTRVIGEGGFGIVYEADDTSLERRVAVKEYMPAELAERAEGMAVRCLDEDDEDIFRKGLQSFINEAKILARFDNASLVKVYRFWEANDTAYMVMPYYEGPTLLEALRKLHRPPEESWLRQLLDPLTQALAVIHEENVYHRDISPDNILLLAGSGRPLLLDFGAARRVISDANQNTLTAIVKPGYAPIEQYSEINLKQGPWSDVYALAAVLHFAITGKKPPAAIARLAGDAYVPLSTLAAGRYSPALLAAIDRGLIVKPDERTQNMDAFRSVVGLPPLARDAAGALISTGSAPAGFGLGPGSEADAPATTRSKALGTASKPGWSLRPTSATAPAGARRTGLVVAAAALVLSAGAGWWWWQGNNPPQAGPVRPVPSAGTDTQVDAKPAVKPAEPDPSAAPAPTVAAAPAPAPASAAASAFSVLDEFARIQSLSSPGLAVTVQWPSKPVFRIKHKDVLALNVTSKLDGYLYVFGFTPDNMLFQYFPHALTQNNFVRKLVTQHIPRPVTDPASKLLHEGIVLTEPAGKGYVLVIVSKLPRDFSLLGNRQESIYPLYPVGQEAERLQRQAGNVPSVYLGQARCPPGPVCDDQFAATMASFDINP